LWESWSAAFAIHRHGVRGKGAILDQSRLGRITLHSYRVRWGNAAPAPGWAQLDAKLAAFPPIDVPAVQLFGRDDGAVLAESTKGQESFFVGPYRGEMLPDTGHSIPANAPTP